MRVNVVIESTMRDGEKVAATMDSLREAGDQIDARALAVTSRLSEQGIMQRYEKQKVDRGAGRMTTIRLTKRPTMACCRPLSASRARNWPTA